jgi:hypothetical protein
VLSKETQFQVKSMGGDTASINMAGDLPPHLSYSFSRFITLAVNNLFEFTHWMFSGSQSTKTPDERKFEAIERRLDNIERIQRRQIAEIERRLGRMEKLEKYGRG